jgi:hypothetical protein
MGLECVIAAQLQRLKHDDWLEICPDGARMSSAHTTWISGFSEKHAGYCPLRSPGYDDVLRDGRAHKNF